MRWLAAARQGSTEEFGDGNDDTEGSAAGSPPHSPEWERRSALGWLEATSPARPPQRDGDEEEDGRPSKVDAAAAAAAAEAAAGAPLLTDALVMADKLIAALLLPQFAEAAAEPPSAAAAAAAAAEPHHCDEPPLEFGSGAHDCGLSSPGAESSGSNGSPAKEEAPLRCYDEGGRSFAPQDDTSFVGAADDAEEAGCSADAAPASYSDAGWSAMQRETGDEEREADSVCDGQCTVDADTPTTAAPAAAAAEEVVVQAEEKPAAAPPQPVVVISDAASVSQAAAPATAAPKWQRVNGKWAFC